MPQLHAGQLILQNLLKAVRNPIVWIPFPAYCSAWRDPAAAYAQYAY
jgi:hypothetical protein